MRFFIGFRQSLVSNFIYDILMDDHIVLLAKVGYQLLVKVVLEVVDVIPARFLLRFEHGVEEVFHYQYLIAFVGRMGVNTFVPLGCGQQLLVVFFRQLEADRDGAFRFVSLFLKHLYHLRAATLLLDGFLDQRQGFLGR